MIHRQSPSRSSRRAAALTAVLLGLLPSFLCAAVDTSIVGVQKKPYAPTVLTMQPLPPAQQAQLLQKLDTLRTALRATPVLRDLRGYDWQAFASIKTYHSDPKAPIAGVLGYIVHPYTIYPGRPTQSSAEGPPFNIYINDPEQMLPNQLYDVDQDARFATEPKVTGEIDGFPVYGGEMIFISRRGASPFVPVSQQRYLERRIDVSKAELAEMNKTFSSVPVKPKSDAAAEREKFLGKFEDRLASLERELADLSADERAADAWIGGNSRPSRPSGLARSGVAGASRIVTLNPQLYDATKPRTAIQNILLGTPRYLPEVYSNVQRQLDKQAVLSVID